MNKNPRANWPGNKEVQEPLRSYYFVLGRQPLISLAELAAVLKHQGIEPKEITWGDSVAFVEKRGELDTAQILKKLGGTIKSGRVLLSPAPLTANAALENIPELVWQTLQAGGIVDSLVEQEKRATFAMSIYVTAEKEDVPVSDRRELIEMMNKLAKSKLSELGSSCRYLEWTGSGKAEPISSAQLMRTHTIEKGVEVCLFWGDDDISIGITEAVQDLESYAKRDIQKPYRRTTEGLLPPKLARMMVNLSKQSSDGLLLDPFCGSGVLLMEALQLGLNVVGSDLEPDAVDATQVNVKWLYNNAEGLPDASKNQFFLHDARRLTERIKPLSIDCIATEPYLGPPLKKPANPIEAASILKSLRPLYIETLAELRSVLRPGGKIVVIIPRFASQQGRGYSLDLTDEMLLMGYRILDPLEGLGISHPHPYLLYARANQRVQREIWILESKK